MIIPKTHHLSMREYYSNKEFIELLDQVAVRVRAEYGSLIMFEHGASSENSPTGCGVDHAHFHIVPSQPISNELAASDLEWERIDISEFQNSTTPAREYLFYTDDVTLEHGLLHQLDTSVSQYFRNLLAKRLNVEKLSNYREHLFFENSKQTFSKLVGA